MGVKGCLVGEGVLRASWTHSASGDASSLPPVPVLGEALAREPGAMDFPLRREYHCEIPIVL